MGLISRQVAMGVAPHSSRCLICGGLIGENRETFATDPARIFCERFSPQRIGTDFR